MLRPTSIGQAHRIIVQLEGRIAELEQPWISVEDRMPKHHSWCFAAFTNGGVWLQFWDATEKEWIDDEPEANLVVTHWQPLPEPPLSDECEHNYQYINDVCSCSKCGEEVPPG